MKPFFEPIIRRWDRVVDFASDVGCTERVARQWIHTDSIPATWFLAVSRAAMRRGHIDITSDLLAGLAEKRRLLREGEKASEAA